MSSKGPWEKRVGLLLSQPEFAWRFKPPDTQFYGGQPRVDWLACDFLGKFWMIEVKQAAPDRKSINILTDVSAGQRDALSAIAGAGGVALLAIGAGADLYVHSWRAAWQQHVSSLEAGLKTAAVLKLEGPSLLQVFHWSGLKAWMLDHLCVVALSELPPPVPTPTIPAPPSVPSDARTRRRSILKRVASIHTPGQTPP